MRSRRAGFADSPAANAEAAVTHPAIAQDLIGRVSSAAATWRAPLHQRAARTADHGVGDAVPSAAADSRALRRIVERLGCWPGRTQVGDQACQAALVIALASGHDLHFQVTLLYLLHDATTAQWAHLYDRRLALSGLPQKYGTLYWLCDGRIELHPLADPAALDTLRAGIGLPPQPSALKQGSHLLEPSRWLLWKWHAA
ncbi:DUF6624 domain-containing protein [Streptomyces sp. NPDC091278]|uniref:DUF6624 domain-containing protein n=1 Tax=Streptomyces sp. NPDC091278 TaxID=3155301 RepID=UPI00344FB001